MPLVIESLLVDKSVIEAVDADNGNVLIVVVCGNFFYGIVDFIESVDREKIFTFGVIGIFKASPRQRAFIVDVKDNGSVGIEGFKGEGFT